MSRRFQFSLRALLVGVLVLSAFLAGMLTQKAFDDWKYRAVYDRLQEAEHLKD